MECPGIFFLSSFHDTCSVGIIGKKRKLNKRQGFTDLKVFENGMPDHIFLSSFHDSCTRGKRKLNMRQGVTYCKGFENGNA